jgi:hypothetical protein
MTIPNDDGRRDLNFRSRVEALMALEAFSIGAATMMVTTNRGQRQMHAVHAMRERLIVDTGLSKRVAETLADDASLIFRLVERLEKPGVQTVTFFLGKKGKTIECAVNGQVKEFCRIDLDQSERARITAEGFWESERQEEELCHEVYDQIVPETIAFLRDLADMGVEFSSQVSLSAAVPRSMIAERKEAAVTETVERLLQDAFGEAGGETRLLGLKHDIWADRPMVLVEMDVILPSVAHEGAAEILEAAIQASPVTLQPAAPRP